MFVWSQRPVGRLGFGVLGVYPLLRVLLITVPPLRRVTFSKRRKSNQKGFPPAYGTSLRLSVPSLRCPSGGIAYGLLRCTSSRCMRLRRMTLRAYPRMDTFARPAEGAEDQKPDQEPKPKPKPKQIKRSQPSAAPTWDRCFQLEIGRLSGRHRWQASSHNFIRAHPMRRSRPTQHDER